MSAVLLAITILFFSAQFHVPIIDYRQHDSCRFYVNHWGICPLEQLNEPSLFYYNVDSGETIYRLIRTSRGYPQAIRIHLNHAERVRIMHFTFFGIEEEGRTIYSQPEKIEKEFTLDSRQYQELTRLFSRRRFWQTPAYSERIGFGGFTWTLEGVDSNRYHIVVRWLPEYGNVARLGESLFDYAFSLLDEYGYGRRYIFMR